MVNFKTYFTNVREGFYEYPTNLTIDSTICLSGTKCIAKTFIEFQDSFSSSEMIIAGYIGKSSDGQEMYFEGVVLNDPEYSHKHNVKKGSIVSIPYSSIADIF